MQPWPLHREQVEERGPPRSQKQSPARRANDSERKNGPQFGKN